MMLFFLILAGALRNANCSSAKEKGEGLQPKIYIYIYIFFPKKGGGVGKPTVGVLSRDCAKGVRD